MDEIQSNSLISNILYKTKIQFINIFELPLHELSLYTSSLRHSMQRGTSKAICQPFHKLGINNKHVSRQYQTLCSVCPRFSPTHHQGHGGVTNDGVDF
ncbi:hypothetical protein CDAR_281241 [Caerostris darwini]|uniref:Uncharacterized protein n=1 Tax=Caerostris darwini TaxID=1538125 RepID=A0AAV4WY85_9ARAC|nr:hypothetical protein CDAR_281241 [Caerostris darwini]